MFPHLLRARTKAARFDLTPPDHHFLATSVHILELGFWFLFLFLWGGALRGR